jgi:hypothetical protein
MGKRVPRPSPAMIVALLALCLAVGGTAFAAVKLGKNAVKTKNIKNGAVTEAKIAGNAVTEGKIAGGAVTEGKIANGAVTGAKIAGGAVGSAQLSGTAKTIWVETELGSTTNIKNQSGGISLHAGPATGETVVDFGTDVTNRAISVTPNLNLGAVTVEYGRCTDVGCGPTFTDNPDAVEVFTFATDTGNLVNSGFLAMASP